MKTKLFLLLSFSMFMLGLKAQNISIPDANFKAKLLSSSPNNIIAKDLSGNNFKIDANNDGQISLDEAQQVGTLNITYSDIHSLEGIAYFTNLAFLYCSDLNINNLEMSNMSKLQTLILHNTAKFSLYVHDFPLLKTFQVADFSTNTPRMNLIKIENLPLVQVYDDFKIDYATKNLEISNLSLLKYLSFSDRDVDNVTLNNLNSLTRLDCNNNNLSSLDVSGLPKLKTVYGMNNKITSLNINNTYLEELYLANNLITSLQLNTPKLNILDCSYNQLPFIDINSIFPVLSRPIDRLLLDHNHLTNINLSNRKINYAHFSYNELNTFIAENLISISINISNNLLATLNVNNANTVHFDCSHNQFQTLDFSKFTTNSIYSRIYTLNDNPNLKVILMKNGTFNYFENYNNLPQLKYICSDEDEISYLQSELQNNGITSANVGSYCNFTPGGNYNTITGTVRFDENNNGCDTNDEVFEFLKLKINDGTNSGETFVKNDGSYNFYTQSGDFTVTAEPENPSLYTVTPSSFSTNFVDNNNNISTQNICVTKNGHVKDLEVVFAPVTDARPGFDAVYKVIWRNKGNTTLSGSVTVNFNNSKLNFLSSSLPSTVSGNQVTFNFTNLKPYQNTASEITFNVNPPTHATNPVNIGDILNFSANITPLSGDANQDDNQFVYKQTVVGSYDPNDITCLEGNTIPLVMVGKYLHYIVNFENTGTAPATNIVVETEINPEDFDISSLQLQNTSHNSYTKITGNKLEFMMKDINLAASAHGNIALKIKSKNNLVSGDSVNNKANIYFDYNFPVETNDAVTNIEGSTLSATENNKGKTSVNVYPNPTKGDVNINADSKINSIEIYDAQGRIIQKQIGVNSQNTKVSIHSNTSGMYILKIITEKETLTKKIIKN